MTCTFFSFALVAAASAQTLSRWRPLARREGHVAVALLALALLLVPTFRPGRLPAILAPEGSPPPERFAGREAVKVLRAQELAEPITILESSYSRAFYAGIRFRCVTPIEKASPFWTFVHDKGIDVMVIDDRLRADPRFRDDPEFVAFTDGRAREDFEVITVPDVHVDVAIHKRARRHGAKHRE
jgi:hypothetical protein